MQKGMQKVCKPCLRLPFRASRAGARLDSIGVKEGHGTQLSVGCRAHRSHRLFASLVCSAVLGRVVHALAQLINLSLKSGNEEKRVALLTLALGGRLAALALGVYGG